MNDSASMSEPSDVRVFVVDDEGYQLACYRDALGDAEIKARFFASAGEALLAAGRYKPAVVLTDYTMPEMNGVELAKRLSELDQSVRVIIMTGHVGEIFDKLLATTREMTNVDVVAKPIKLMDLLARINEILELRDKGLDK